MPDVAATRPLTEDDFAGIAEQGFNVVRLSISWSALEPERGELDDAYLAQITDAVDWAKEHGIYVVLDMHQDSLVQRRDTEEGTACRPGTDPMWGYDGAPDVGDHHRRRAALPVPGPRHLAGRQPRVPELLLRHRRRPGAPSSRPGASSPRSSRDEPAVAGYDLLNEPGFGETAPVTTSLLLGRYYDRAIEAIRAAGAPQIVFVEPSILWSGLGFDSGPPPGFTDDRNIVFSPHLYAESLTMDRSLGIPPIVGMDRQFDLAQRVADEYGAPLWSGEYGYWGDDADVVERLSRYADARRRPPARQRLLGVEAGLRRPAERHRAHRQRAHGAGLRDRRRRRPEGRPPPDPELARTRSRRPACSPRSRPTGARVELAGTAERPQLRPRGVGPRRRRARREPSRASRMSRRPRCPAAGRVTGCADGDYTLSTD